MKLEGRVALVTGGAQRVGRAVALRLAQAGCDVAITFRHSAEQARRLVSEIRSSGRRAWAIKADLSDPRCVGHIRNELLGSAGRIDVLVHNASEFTATPWGSLSAEDWSRQMSVNVMVPVLLTQALREELAADGGGRVVHFLDIHVMGRPRVGYAAYNASKAALLEMTYTLALEMAPHVTVNAIAPGVVEWAQAMTEAQKRSYLARVPLERPGTPQDAASAVLFLVRDADYLTGQIIRVDGGRWLT